MELVDEDNMYHMDFPAEVESLEIMSNNSNHSMTIEENQTEKEPQETEQPLYKLSNIDTEASVKTEIKQLVLSKISEEIDSNTLDYRTFEAEEQISTLRDKTDSLENKIQELDKEVEIDQNRLAQTEVILMKTNEMISLLKENTEKLMIRYRESRMNELSETSALQHEKLDLLKISYLAQLDKEKEDLKNKEAAGVERSTVLKSELTQKEDILKALRKKQDEFKRVIISYDDKIEKLVAKRQTLEQKLSSVANKRVLLENEFMKQRDAFKSLSLKGADVDKVTELNEQQATLEQQVETLSHELKEAKSSLAANENQILQKEITVKELTNKLETVKQEFQEGFDKLQLDYNNTSQHLSTISTDLTACTANNDHLSNEINALNAKYIQKCKEELSMVNINLEKHNDMQKVKMDLIKKQTANELEQTKYEELQKEYEKSLELLRSLENDTQKEQEKRCDELRQFQLKYEDRQAENDKYFLEMKKKKEYLLASSKFLEEISENVKQSRTEVEKSVKYLEEENASLKHLIGKILNQLDERKKSISALKKDQNEVPLKSTLKLPSKENAPKKVKFSEILSFKSPSSSEVSNFPVDIVTQLETSLHEWLGETKDESNPLENIEEEF